MRLEPPSWWYEGPVPAAAWALWPIAAVYGRIVERRFRTASPYRSKLPVICIGNVTLGGAGKTPLALKVASLLRGAGKNPGFLTRGYGGSERGPYLLTSAADDAEKVGDEPLLLGRAAPTAVSRNRPAGAKLLETLAVDAIVMDDGFQNPSLEKDFTLIAVDAGAAFGSGHVFPLGPLRAPIEFQVCRADAVVILGAKDCSSGSVAETIGRLRGKLGLAPLPVFEARIVPLDLDDLRDRSFLAFCGIGRPGKFFGTLQQAGIAVAGSRSFPDHHAYTEADARELIAKAKTLNAALITTEKDHVRLRGKGGALGDLYKAAIALPITVKFLGEGEALLMDLLTAAAFQRRAVENIVCGAI